MLEITKRLLRAAEGGEPVFLASVLESGPRPLVPGARMLVERSGERLGSLGDTALDDALAAYAPDAFAAHIAATLYVTPGALSERTAKGATAVYVEVVEAKPVFLIVGAGHIGRSLAKLADFLDFHVAILDDRDDFASSERVPEADEVLCEDFEEALKKYPIGPSTYITLVTRGHKQDELSLRTCLGRGAAYLGMIGSRRRTGAVLEHLREDGFDPEELARVRTPIGLSIGAETPEEIAISIMAEVIMLRRGGDGSVMYHR
ncbi:MAG: XdhC family protein [Dehalococcoidia bacterium]|nr:XdhC family protein [Dehalococcoidia bacterium]